VVCAPGGRVRAVRLERTRVEGGRAVPTGEFEEVAAELVLRSIGYKGIPVAGVPFDTRKGVVPNAHG
jgi:ferredoxin--NADP+ reductase